MPKLTKQCPTCGKVAEEKSSTFLEAFNFRIINLQCGHSYTEKVEPLKDWQKIETLPEFGKPIKLFPYQGEGYEFARESNFRCLIGDEPGLGKTFQALACLRLHPEELSPCLIVCKSALKLQQLRSVVQMCGPEFTPEIISKSSDRPSGLFPVTIVTYDILWRISKRQIEALEKVEKSIRERLNLDEWQVIPEAYEHELPKVENPFVNQFKLVILDECQQIKNPASKRAQQVRDICRTVPHIIATSGSPIENHAGEYYTILNIIKPERFPSYKDYVINYCDYYDTAYGAKIGGIRDIAWFKERTKDFIIRRKMDDVLKDLPKLYRKFTSCEFGSDKLKREYEELQEEFSKYFHEHEGEEDFQQGILARMAKMRHVTGISKVPFVTEYITDLLNDTNKKYIVFVYHQDVGSVLNARLVREMDLMRQNGSEINNPLQYTADLNSAQRDEIVTKFMTEPNSRVLIASIMAAGEGLDGLQKVCDSIIVMERLWNPKKEEQAEKRVQRIGAVGTLKLDNSDGVYKDDSGQVGRINADYILTAGTIDEYLTELVEVKRANTDQTLDGVEYSWNEASLIKELGEVLASKGGKKWRLK